MIKLSEIDPQTLAVETLRRAYDDAHRVLMELSPMSVVDPITSGGASLWAAVEASPTSSVAGHAIVALTHYAQSGAPLDADVHEYCVSLIPVAGEALDDVSEPDPRTPLGLVVSAALAREAIDRGLSVPLPRLGHLAGIGGSGMRMLVQRGELARDEDDRIAAADARRWLDARGVPGYRRTAR